MKRFVKLSRGAAILAACAFATTVGGCGPPSPSSVTLDKQVAKDALNTVLETWKKGGKPADLKNRTPQIIVIDEDWNEGKQLVRFHLSGKDQDTGRSLRIPATVIVKDAKGKLAQSEAIYVVGTSPVITVGRE